MITLKNVQDCLEIQTLINAANDNLEVMGYTEHGMRHVSYVSKNAAMVLEELGYDERTVELAAIGGFMHDIGNMVNRHNHGLTGALMAYEALLRMGMCPKEVVKITAAIGNHEEETGTPVSEVAAAVIIADKSDAHRTRVRRKSFNKDDIHDRVNNAIKKNFLAVDKEKRVISLFIYMNKTSAIMEFLKIYLSRIILCERAATYLNCAFELVINDKVINKHSV
ncbi:MAG: HD domain-containing protein [Firmicutes bacterium]|nr:HD domain-containing protein [Bacillota bacterium]MCL2255388.1 HD domain-containing protein [Bacillota bacterium]